GVLSSRHSTGAVRASNLAVPGLHPGSIESGPWWRNMVSVLGLDTPVTARYWLRDGGLFATGPTSDQKRTSHERVLARVASDSMLVKLGHTEDEGGRPLTKISFSKYLERLNPPDATRNLFSAWWTVSGNGDPSTVAASEFLGSCRYGDGLAEGMMDVWAHT